MHRVDDLERAIVQAVFATEIEYGTNLLILARKCSVKFPTVPTAVSLFQEEPMRGYWLSLLCIINLFVLLLLHPAIGYAQSTEEPSSEWQPFQIFGLDDAVVSELLPDDIHIIYGTAEFAVLMDITTGTKERFFFAPASVLAVSPDGKRLLTGGGEYTEPIRLWSVHTGELLSTYADFGVPNALAFSPDGSQFLAGLRDDAALLDVATGAVLHRFEPRGPVVIGFTQDGLGVFTGNKSDPLVYLWDVENGKLLRSFEHSNGIKSLDVSNDGSRLAVTTFRSEIAIWSLDTTDDPVLVFDDQGRSLKGGVFSSDGMRLAAIDRNGVGFWDVETGERTGSLKQEYPSSSLAGALLDWYIPPLSIIHPHTVRFNSSGSHLLAVNERQPAAIYFDLVHDEVSFIQLRLEFADSTVILPDNATFASWDNHFLNLWDLETGRRLRNIEGERPLIVSPDGRLGAYIYGGYEVRLWDFETEKMLHTLTADNAGFGEAFFSPTGDTLFVMTPPYSRRPTIFVWEVETGDLLKTLDLQQLGNPSHPVLSPDGRFLALNTVTEGTALWNMETGTMHTMLPGTASQPAVFSPDGARLYRLIIQEGIVEHKTETGEHLTTIGTGGYPFPSAFTLSPDGETLLVSKKVSGEGVQTQLINLETDDIQQVITGNKVPVNRIYFSPDGTVLVLETSRTTWLFSQEPRIPSLPDATPLLPGKAQKETLPRAGWHWYKMEAGAGEEVHVTVEPIVPGVLRRSGTIESLGMYRLSSGQRGLYDQMVTEPDADGVYTLTFTSTETTTHHIGIYGWNIINDNAQFEIAVTVGGE